MPLTEKFGELISEINNTFKGNEESLDGLSIKLLSADELYYIGFIQRNVRSIMLAVIKDNNNGIDEYFNENCRELLPEEVGAIDFGNEPLPAGVFLDRFKTFVVEGQMVNTLYNHIKTLKSRNYDKRRGNNMQDSQNMSSKNEIDDSVENNGITSDKDAINKTKGNIKKNEASEKHNIDGTPKTEGKHEVDGKQDAGGKHEVDDYPFSIN